MLLSFQDRNVWLSLVERLRKHEQLPVVAFTFSRNRCDGNADQLSNLELTTKEEQSVIKVFTEKAIARLKGSDKNLPQVPSRGDSPHPSPFCTRASTRSVPHVGRLPHQVSHVANTSTFCTRASTRSVPHVGRLPHQVSHVANTSPFCTRASTRSVPHVGRLPHQVSHVANTSPFCTRASTRSVPHVGRLPHQVAHVANTSSGLPTGQLRPQVLLLSGFD